MSALFGLIRRFGSHAVVQNSLVVMAGSVVANLLAYFYHLVVGRILGPEQYGELAALLSLFYILNVPSTVVATVLTKFFSVLRAGRKTGEAKYLFFRSLSVIFLCSLIGFGIVMLGASAIAAFLRIESVANVYWLYAIFVLYFIGMVPVSLLTAYQKFFVQSVISTLGMGLRLVCAVLAAPLGVTATLASNIFANMATLAVSALPLQFVFRASSRPVTIPRRRTFGYSVPALITTLAIAALYNQDVLLVKHFFSSAEAGIYSSLSVLGKIIFYASSALTFVLFPVISERSELKRGTTKLVAMSLLGVAGLSGVLTLFYFLFPGFVVHILYGPSFDAAVPYVGLFGIFISFFALDNMLFSICLAAEKIRVWAIGGMAALLQFLLIWIYHSSLQTVIIVNAMIAAGLFAALLLYYAHDAKSS